MRRMVVVKNRSGFSEIVLLEIFMTGRRGTRIVLPPLTSREFAASRFCNANRDALEASTVDVYVDGKQAQQSLTPEVFRRYVQLNFDVEQGTGNLTVTGIEPRSTDFCRLWGLGVFGRSYEGRPEQIIQNYY